VKDLSHFLVERFGQAAGSAAVHVAATEAALNDGSGFKPSDDIPAGAVTLVFKILPSADTGRAEQKDESAFRSPDSAVEPLQNKRKRTDVQDIAPPVSGSAVDSSRTRTLEFPTVRESWPASSESKWHRKDLQVNEHLAAVYARGMIQDTDGTERKFQDCVDPFEGRHLYDLIFANRFTRTLEVGLAMGASAVWMCQAHADWRWEASTCRSTQTRARST